MIVKLRLKNEERRVISRIDSYEFNSKTGNFWYKTNPKPLTEKTLLSNVKYYTCYLESGEVIDTYMPQTESFPI